MKHQSIANIGLHNRNFATNSTSSQSYSNNLLLNIDSSTPHRCNNRSPARRSQCSLCMLKSRSTLTWCHNSNSLALCIHQSRCNCSLRTQSRCCHTANNYLKHLLNNNPSNHSLYHSDKYYYHHSSSTVSSSTSLLHSMSSLQPDNLFDYYNSNILL
jgi:hypothetical protein